MTVADLKRLEIKDVPPPTARCTFDLTDLGNAERLVAMFGDVIRFSPERGLFLVWSEKDGRWGWDRGVALQAMGKAVVKKVYTEAAEAKGDQAKLLARHAVNTQRASRLKAMIDLTRNEPGIQIQVLDLDSNPWLLNCDNGTLDLRTLALLPPSRDQLMTKTTGVSFKPGANSDLWRNVLKRATGGDVELEAYLQRVAGYAAVGLATERAFFFLHGPPGTAKSTILDALQVGLGDYAHATSSDTWLARPHVGGNRDDLVDLQGVRLAVSSEVRKGARWDEAIIKRVTGGDVLSESRKYEGRVQFRVTCTIIMAANDAPMVRDDDEGLWARMRRIPLETVIPAEQQLPDLKERLREPEHAQAILAWIAQGARQWQLHGTGTCQAVEKGNQEYRKESDRLSEFLEDAVVLEPEVRVRKSDLRARYQSWCEEAGVKPMVDRELAKRLRALGVEQSKSHGHRVWIGARLRTVDDD